MPPLSRTSIHSTFYRVPSIPSLPHTTMSQQQQQQQPYELAFQLNGHASDVRTLCAPSPDIPLLISGSRDGSALLWGPGRGSEWDVKLRVEAPEKKYVSCVGMTKWGGEGELWSLLVESKLMIAFLLVGSSSGILSTYTLPSASSNPPPEGQMQDPYHTLIEHKQNLCCMDTSKNNLIATGSWDQYVSPSG